ncbi:MAG: hypothetical protein J6N77_06155 [Lachnospiraceae bacterium]|nr:hypothetical protein [Lachnospiraceae bacterium]
MACECSAHKDCRTRSPHFYAKRKWWEYVTGRHVHEDVQCTCGIASRQTYKELMRDGYIDMLVDAGVRMLEISCGPCCAIGQTLPPMGWQCAPPTGISKAGPETLPPRSIW